MSRGIKKHTAIQAECSLPADGTLKQREKDKKMPLNANSEASEKSTRLTVWRQEGGSNPRKEYTMTEINNSLVLERLIANKHLFGPLYFGPLKWMAEHGGWFYRKEAEEANPRLHYLPSWYQDAGPRLEIAGLQIEARPALDGSCRKKYALTPLLVPVVAQTAAEVADMERKNPHIAALNKQLRGMR